MNYLRLYLAAAPGDMDGERAVLEGLVLPELRARLQGHGIEIVAVDPANVTGEAWDLARRFQEIDGCQLFIGLLGERYRGAPARVSLPMVLAQPWIAEDPGRSMLELEILQGALREPERRTSFFYFRNPRFPSMVPEVMRGRFLPENDEAVTRLEDLKERIRSSGRPVFDGYPCGWSEGLGRASRLDTFAEQVFEDLWNAIQEIVRRTAEEAPVASVPSPPEPTPATPVPAEKALPPFDPNATILSFSRAQIPLPSPDVQPEETKAESTTSSPLLPAATLAPSMTPPAILLSPRPWMRQWVRIAAMIALAVLGLALVLPAWRLVQRSASGPVRVAVPDPSRPTDPVSKPRHPDPAFPTITPEAWKRLATACRLGSAAAQSIPTRVPAGSLMVQVLASTDWTDASHILSRYSSRHGFLLPQEETGHAVCTVVIGPFPSQEAASRAAAELRMSEGTDAKVVPFPGFTK